MMQHKGSKKAWHTRANVLIGVMLVLLVGAVGCEAISPPPESAAKPPTTPKETTILVVSAEGIVSPIQRASMAFKVSGRVAQVSVKEGDLVKKGDRLISLDDTTLQRQIQQAATAVNVAQKQLAQLKVGATGPERQAAQDALVAARANYAKVKAGPTKEELARLQSELDSAQAAVKQTQTAYDRIGGDQNRLGAGAPERLALEQAWIRLDAANAAIKDAKSHPTDAEIKQALAAVTQAESAVARLDPSPEAIALAEAQVAQAESALNVAKAGLLDTFLEAPFDGTIAQISLNVGDFATPGVPAVVMGNLSKLRVETTDLSEVDVAKVKVKQSVKVTLDAFPNQTFQGTVANVAPISNENRGDKVFKVWIDLKEGTETGLRWGMVAQVEISVGE